MRDGIQQCGLQPLSLPLSFRQAELFYSSRPFDGDGHQAAHRIERLPRESCSGNTEAPDGPHAKTHGNKVKTLLPFNGHFIAEERRLHFFFIEMSSAIPRSIELFFLRKEQLSGTRLEALHDVIWYCIHQLDDIAFPKQFLAEFVESFDLTAAAVRFVCFSPDPRRELAAHDGGN